MQSSSLRMMWVAGAVSAGFILNVLFSVSNSANEGISTIFSNGNLTPVGEYLQSGSMLCLFFYSLPTANTTPSNAQNDTEDSRNQSNGTLQSTHSFITL